MIVNYSDEEIKIGEKSIFLAGPTSRKEATRWRDEAIKILEELKFEGIVYNPEYSTRLPKEDYVDQAMWERHGLMNATIILFWVPRHLPDMPGFTTNVEFGYWLHSGKVLYGRPDEAEKIKYLDWLYELDYDKKPINDLKELIEEAIKIINNNKK